MSYEEYSQLAGMGYGSGKEQIAPEDEYFHNIYIAGTTRKNHIQVEEIAGKLQVRGVEYNLNEVHMIITQVKDMLVKNVTKQGRDSLECFSFKEPPSGPWHGTSKLSDGTNRPCPATTAERQMVEYCNPCKTQLVVAGIYCKPDGTPILKESKEGGKEAIYVFIRAKGVKFSSVSSYLSDMAREEFDPIFTPVTDESLDFEKKVVNNKRVVTKVSIGKTKTQYGDKPVFELSKGVMLPKETTVQILGVTKKTLPKFNEKFDWSKGKVANQATASYAGTGVLSMDVDDKVKQVQPPAQPPKPEVKEQPKVESPPAKVFSFDDIKF